MSNVLAALYGGSKTQLEAEMRIRVVNCLTQRFMRTTLKQWLATTGPCNAALIELLET